MWLDAPRLDFAHPEREGGVTKVRDALVCLDNDHPSKDIDVVAWDSALTGRRKVGKMAGGSIPADGISALPGTGRIFAADALGILEHHLDGRMPVRLVGLPDHPLHPDRAHLLEKLPVEMRGRAEIPGYCWLMHLEETGARLFTHTVRMGGHDQLVEVDVTTRSFARLTPLTGCCAQIAVSSRHAIIVLPAFEQGAEVQDLAGKTLATLAPGLIPDADWFQCAIHPVDGSVTLGGRGAGLWRWDWRSGAVTQLVADGTHPAWSPDGQSLYFLRTASELWCRHPGGNIAPLVQALGTTDPSIHGWGRSPLVSPDGRFVFHSATVTGKSARHAAVVVEVATGRFVQAPGFHPYSVCWT